MKFLILVLVCAFSFLGCNQKKGALPPVEQFACQFEGAVVTIASGKIATELVCSNQAAIAKTLQGLIKSADLCTKKAKRDKAKAEGAVGVKSVIGDMVCEPGLAMLSLGALSSIPVEWGCSGPANLEEMKQDILNACLEAL